MKTKICTLCKIEKPLDNEHFERRKDSKDNFRNRCRQCSREWRKQYYKENKSATLKQRKEYYEKNKGDIRKTHKEYYQKNRDKLLEYDKSYIEKNRRKVAERKKKWHKKNKIARNGYRQKRIALKKNLPCTLSTREWIEIKNDFKNQCAYCGISESEHLEQNRENLHREHFIALSKGGGYTRNNIIPSCRNCNSSKGDRDFFEWYRDFEHYNEQRKQFILSYLKHKERTQQLALF